MNTVQSWFFIRPLMILLIVCSLWILVSVIRAIAQRIRRPETPARAETVSAMTAARS